MYDTLDDGDGVSVGAAAAAAGERKSTRSLLFLFDTFLTVFWWVGVVG